MNYPAPTIHIVDDDQSCRKSLARLLTVAGFEARTYASAAEFLLARVNATPGCIILDIRMPGLNGLDLHESLAMQDEPLPVIFLTGHGDIVTSVRAMKAGAIDFLTKPVKRDTLLNTVRNALARDAETRVIREQLSRWRQYFNALTPRERQVFDGVVAGKPNKQIALDLGASERTVKAHRAHVMAKMHAGSLADLIHTAEQLQRAHSPQTLRH
jgi:FixJ family two-component response regulator